MKHQIEHITMDIFVEREGKSYNVEYSWELTDTNEYWSAIEAIYDYKSGETIDEDSDVYKALEEYVYDLNIEIKQGDATK